MTKEEFEQLKTLLCKAGKYVEEDREYLFVSDETMDECMIIKKTVSSENCKPLGSPTEGHA